MVHVSFCVPFYNAAPRLREGYLDHFVELTEETAADVELVVLDDASTDATLSILNEYSGSAHVLSHTHNTNTDSSYNDLLVYSYEHLDTDYVLLFDQDSHMSASAVDTMVDLMEANSDLGILQPFCSREGGVYSYGHRFNDRYMAHPIQRRYAAYHQKNSPYIPRESVSFVGTFIRPAVVDDIGILEERYGRYWESSDYCFRARNAGWRVGVTKRATSTHERDLSESDADDLYFVYRNWLLFWTRFDTRIARKIREDLWPSLNNRVNVSDVTEDVDAVEDSVLERARKDALEMTEEFSSTNHFQLTDRDEGRVVIE